DRAFLALDDQESVMELESTVRAATADLDAFAEITRRFQHMAFAYALSVVGDLGRAEDVVSRRSSWRPGTEGDLDGPLVGAQYRCRRPHLNWMGDSPRSSLEEDHPSDHVDVGRVAARAGRPAV